MTPDDTRKLIDAAGGNKAFAMQLGIDIVNDPAYVYRVSAWRRRGLPPKVELEKLNEIASMRKSAARRGAL